MFRIQTTQIALHITGALITKSSEKRLALYTAVNKTCLTLQKDIAIGRAVSLAMGVQANLPQTDA